MTSQKNQYHLIFFFLSLSFQEWGKQWTFSLLLSSFLISTPKPNCSSFHLFYLIDWPGEARNEGCLAHFLWPNWKGKTNEIKKQESPYQYISIHHYNINKNMSTNTEQNFQNLDSKNTLRNRFIPKTSDQSDEQEYKLKFSKTKDQISFFETRPKSQRWTAKQNKLYLKFLQDHGSMFRYKSVRRIKQIYSLLSEKMGGKRTASQCKSHHLKMKKATLKGTVKEIMSYIKDKIYLDQIKQCSKEKAFLQLKQKNDGYCEENENENPKLSEQQFEIRVNKWSRNCSISINICLNAIGAW